MSWWEQESIQNSLISQGFFEFNNGFFCPGNVGTHLKFGFVRTEKKLAESVIIW